MCIRDRWKNNSGLKPNKSSHFIGGITYKSSNFNSIGIEVYYKNYKDIIVFDSSYNFSNNGNGNAKGIELFEQINWNKLTFKLGYSYALANRKRNLQTQVFPFYFEQNHRLNVLANFTPESKLKKWLPTSYIAQFNMYTGTPFTPVQINTLGTNIMYGDINSARNPNYNNLNIRLVWENKIGKNKKNKLILFLEFWNFYNKKNFKERTYIFNPNTSPPLKVRNNFTDPFLPNFGLKIKFNEKK